MNDLDAKLEELKKYSAEKDLKKLNKRIYNLDLNDSFLSKLNEKMITYVHVKLHNAIAYKKPFAPLDKIKGTHDKVAKLMSKHPIIDDLDKMERSQG